MGLVKFEVDIPNFEKELSISITIRRDGEVFYSTSSPSTVNNTLDLQSIQPKENSITSSVTSVDAVDDVVKVSKKRKKVESNTSSSSVELPKKRGNFMNIEI